MGQGGNMPTNYTPSAHSCVVSRTLVFIKTLILHPLPPIIIGAGHDIDRHRSCGKKETSTKIKQIQSASVTPHYPHSCADTSVNNGQQISPHRASSHGLMHVDSKESQTTG